MATGFSPLLAFGSGLAQGAESVMAQKAAVDAEYRKMAMGVNFKEQYDNYTQQQKDQREKAQIDALNSSTFGTSVLNSNNATLAAHQKAQQGNAAATNAAGTAITGIPGNAPPTNTNLGPSNTPPPTQSAPSGTGQTLAPAVLPPINGNWASGTGAPIPGVPLQSGQPANAAASSTLPPSQLDNATVDTSQGTTQGIPTPSDVVAFAPDGTPLTAADEASINAYAKSAMKQSGVDSSDPAVIKDYQSRGFSQWKLDQAKLQLENQKVQQGLPVNIAAGGPEAQQEYHFLKAQGLVDSPNQDRLTKSEIQQNGQIITRAQNINISAKQGMTTILEAMHNVKDINPGPLTPTRAWLESAWDQMTNQQRSQALSSINVGEKLLVQQMNQQLMTIRQEAGGGMRIGAMLAQIEEKGVADLNKMTPQASFTILLNQFNTYRQLAGQTQALMTPNKYIDPQTRVASANMYLDDNPTTIDGTTPNPNFADYDTYRNLKVSGKWLQGTTQTDVENSTAKEGVAGYTNAVAGGPGNTAPTANPNVDKIAKKYGF